MNKKIMIFYTAAGGGHFIPAKALQEALQSQQKGWQIELVSLYETILHESDLAERIFGISSERIYNRFILQWHWHFLAKILLKPAGLMRILQQKKNIHYLQEFLKSTQPDLIISCIPFINFEIEEAIQLSQIKCPLVIYPTDFDEFHSGAWFAVKNAYYLCSTKTLFEKSQQLDQAITYQLSGVILRPGFKLDCISEKQHYKNYLSLDKNKIIILIQFGAYASQLTLPLIRQLIKNDKYQIIVATGHNDVLYRKLAILFKDTKNLIILPYTEEMSVYMKASDIMIGKPGANSVAEAVASLTPIIFLAPHGFMPQEKAIAAWCFNHDIAIRCKSIKKLIHMLAKKSDHIKGWQKSCANLMCSGLDMAVEKISYLL